jgi:5-methylcytosine-specific restriction protein A
MPYAAKSIRPRQVAAREKPRASAARRGYDSRWQKARLGFLARNPLCVECERRGELTPASVVDHIEPHRGNVGLFWDVRNWQALCKRCHDRKTARGL